MQLDQREIIGVHTSIARVTLRTPRAEDATECVRAGPPDDTFHQSLKVVKYQSDCCRTLQKNMGHGMGVSVDLCTECEHENSTDPCECFHTFAEVVATLNLTSVTWYGDTNTIRDMSGYADALVNLFSNLEIPMGFSQVQLELIIQERS